MMTTLRNNRSKPTKDNIMRYPEGNPQDLLAQKIEAAQDKVIAVTEIDGDEPAGYKSRTGAKRQQYNASSIALREVGAKKRISTCKILEVAA